MRKSTIIDLPKDILAVIPDGESIPEIKEILDEARAGEYHDFKNEKYICGKMAVVSKLTDKRLSAIKKDVMDGVYDEEPDAEDDAKMKAEWLEDGGTEEMFDKLFKQK